MSDYTPTTDEVQGAFARDAYTGLSYAEAEAEFDRWLAQHDREVAARELHQAARLVRLVWTGNTNLPDLNDQEVAYSFDIWLDRLADAYVVEPAVTADGRD